MINVFSTNLKRYRTEKNIGINELGRLVGVSGAYISSLEKGIKTNPSLDLLDQIANVLGTTVIALICENQDEFKTDNIEDIVAIINPVDSIALDNVVMSKEEKEKLKEEFNDALDLIRYSRLKNDKSNND